MFFKVIKDNYILGVGIGERGTEITQSEYDQLTDIFHSMPQKEGYEYRLKTDLTWEEYEREPEPIDDLPDSEALSIILGGEE